MNYSIKWGIKLSLSFVVLMLASNLNAQKFHIAGHLVRCAGNDKLPANSIFFIEGNTIPPDCVVILGAGDAVPVAKGAIYNQDNAQGIGLPGGLWIKAGSLLKTHLDAIKLNKIVVKGGNRNIGIGEDIMDPRKMTTYSRDNIAIGRDIMKKVTDGYKNIAIGSSLLKNNTRGHDNLAIGIYSLTNNTNGYANIAMGRQVLHSNLEGHNNIGIGHQALLLNNEGKYNIALGNNTLFRNTEGNQNIAFGKSALEQNVTGNKNLAIGTRALGGNETGSNNIALGDSALLKNKMGYNNIAIGQKALENSESHNNIAIGENTLKNSLLGWGNISIGRNALKNNKEGHYNLAIGINALYGNVEGEENIAIGSSALSGITKGSNNIGLGDGALYLTGSGNYNVAIGYYTGFDIQDKNKTVTLGYLAPGVDTDGTFSVGYNRKTLMSIDSAGYLYTITNTDDTPLFYHGNDNHKAYTFQNKDGTMTISAKSGKKILNLKNGKDEHLTVSKDGYVGVGTSDPSYPLQIEKIAHGKDIPAPVYFLKAENTAPQQSIDRPVSFDDISIYSQGSILTKGYFVASSDARIKINQGLTNSQEDLTTLNKIRVTNYIKKDPRERHHSVEKRVIAQELEKVYPTAVSRKADVVPDIYLFSRQADLKGNTLSVMLDTSLDKDQEENTIIQREHQKSLAALGTVKEGESFKLLIFEDTEKGNFVSEINKIALTEIKGNGEKLNFDLKPEEARKLTEKKLKVLVYGRYVGDFRTVDYDVISMLNVSATQALSKKITEMETKIEQKESLVYFLIGGLFVSLVLIAGLVCCLFKKKHA